MRGFLAAVAVPELVVLVLSVVTPVWAWFGYILSTPQDVGAFTVVGAVALGGGGLVQNLLWAFVRAPGRLRDRLGLSGLSGLSGSRPPVYLLALLAPVVVGLTLLLVTPAGTSMAVFDPDFSTFSAIALLTLLGVIAATLGGVVLFWLVAVPLALLVAALLPRRSGSATERDDGETGAIVDEVSTGETVTFALLLFATAGFGVGMGTAAPADASSTRASMARQLLDVLTLRGAALPTVLAAVCAVSIVVLLVLHRRFQRRRERVTAG